MRPLFSGVLLTVAIILSPLAASAAPTTAPAPMAKTTPAAAAKTADLAPKVPSAGQQAMHERQKACGAEWKSMKGTKAAEGKKWPQFWSECNKRLKEQKN